VLFGIPTNVKKTLAQAASKHETKNVIKPTFKKNLGLEGFGSVNMDMPIHVPSLFDILLDGLFHDIVEGFC